MLKKPVTELAKQYKLDYLLLRESFATLEDLKMRNAKTIFRSGDVVLVKLT